MSHEVAIDIPSLIRHQSQHLRPECLMPRYQLPEHYYPSYLRHPNQPFSSPSTISSSSSSSPPSSPSSSSLSSFCQEDDAPSGQHQLIRQKQQQHDLHLQSISIDDEEGIANQSSSAIDGEFDVRIDIIHHQSRPLTPITNLVAGVVGIAYVATAPPISDDERDQQPQTQQPQTQQPQQPQQPQTQQPQTQQPQQTPQTQQPQQQTQQKEEQPLCVICYEIFEKPVQLIRGRNYTSEELEEIEGKEKISNFCMTCKYDVHHRCIDEYRLSKVTDIIRSGYQRGYIQSPNVSGIFKMKCLMCSKEVEKIHISANGEINIEKTQPGANEQEQQLQQQEQQQQQQQEQIEEIMRNRMQRRIRRRHRFEFCRKKLCSICVMFLVTVTLLVFIFRLI